jgi:hypothetical protein
MLEDVAVQVPAALVRQECILDPMPPVASFVGCMRHSSVRLDVQPLLHGLQRVLRRRRLWGLGLLALRLRVPGVDLRTSAAGGREGGDEVGEVRAASRS